MTLNTKKHTQEAATKGIDSCSAVLNLREKFLKILYFSNKMGEEVEAGGWLWSDTLSNHQDLNIAVCKYSQNLRTQLTAICNHSVR